MLGIGLAVSSWAQSTIKGTVVDGSDPIIGANVFIENTTIGSTTDINGGFAIKTDKTGEVNLVISFVGYETVIKKISLTGGEVNLGEVGLTATSVGLSEIEVIASLAIDRKTPVAMSTVKAQEIQEIAGNQEFPELLKSTPGVYATKQGGGFGDSRISIRGFGDDNLGVLINGIPVNDMENGRIYWSNWAGLTDVAGQVQVQRGLGASKVAIPSVGGTINIVSRATDAKQGGSFYLGTGNNGYQKQQLIMSSGLMDNGWAVTMSAGHVKGNGYVVGTEFEGFNYFVNIGKMINDNHQITFTALGAPQKHGQRQNRMPISTYRNHPDGIRYNSDAVLDSDVISTPSRLGLGSEIEDNFYHKPLFSLNHYWTINDKMELSTAVYHSVGTGGGGGTYGNTSVFNRGDALNSQFRTNGYIDVDKIIAANKEVDFPTRSSVSALRASRNDHSWSGILSTLNVDLNSNINLMFGLDIRDYVGHHFRNLTDLLGADYLIDENQDINNPNKVVRVGDKIDYHDRGFVRWLGTFAQIEYSKDKLSAFATLQLAQNSYKREDYFRYLDSDPLQKSEWANYTGFGLKGGANYNLTDNHNIFANVGYFERAPIFDTAFPNFANIPNKNAENEKITSLELGYGYRSAKFNANVNVYWTQWADKAFQRGLPPTQSGEEQFANITGVTALHQGLEVDFFYKPSPKFTLNGMLSVADNRWKNNVNAKVFEGNTLLSEFNLFIADLKVGNSAQTTAALGAQYTFFEGFKIGANYNFYDNNYARYDVLSRTSAPEGAIQQPFKMEAFGTLDARVVYDFTIGDFNASFIGNAYNVFDTQYIMDANDGADPLVFFGTGRTWSAGLRVRF